MGIEWIERTSSEQPGTLEGLGAAELEAVEGGIIDGCIRFPPIFGPILGPIVLLPALG